MGCRYGSMATELTIGVIWNFIFNIIFCSSGLARHLSFTICIISFNHSGRYTTILTVICTHTFRHTFAFGGYVNVHLNLRDTIPIYLQAKWWTYLPHNPTGVALQTVYAQLNCLRIHLYNSHLSMVFCRPAVDWLSLAKALNRACISSYFRISLRCYYAGLLSGVLSKPTWREWHG